MVERKGRGGGAGRAEAEGAEERGRVEAEEVEERGRAEAEQRRREEAEEAEERRPADSVARMPNSRGMPTSEGPAGWPTSSESPLVGGLAVSWLRTKDAGAREGQAQRRECTPAHVQVCVTSTRRAKRAFCAGAIARSRPADFTFKASLSSACSSGRRGFFSAAKIRARTAVARQAVER